MKFIKKAAQRTAAIAVTGIACMSLASCGEASANQDHLVTAPEGLCAYLVGKGNQDRNGNRTINHLIAPGNSQWYDDSYDMPRYVPCGPRNFIMTPDSGDLKFPRSDQRLPLPEARTNKNTQVVGELTLQWTPNRKESAFRQFLVLCQKYDCAAADLQTGSSNFGTDGWWYLLRENVYIVLNRLFDEAVATVGDDIWETNNLEARKAVAKYMMDNFKARMQVVTGSTEDIICGPGSSGWGDKFDCQDVQIVVDKVYPKDPALAKVATDKRALELMRDNAELRKSVTDSLYGPELGAQVRACQDNPGAFCAIGTVPVQVQLPK